MQVERKVDIGSSAAKMLGAADGIWEQVEVSQIRKGDKFRFIERPVFTAACDAVLGSAEECAVQLFPIQRECETRQVYFKDGVALCFKFPPEEPE